MSGMATRTDAGVRSPPVTDLLRNVGDLTFRRRILTILEYLAPIAAEDVILDAGCGEGFYVMLLAELTPARVVGIDVNPQLIRKAREWIGENPRVELRVGDVASVPCPDHTFTKIVCSEVLEHLPDPVAVLHELRRVLLPSGTLAVTVPNHRYPFFFDPLNWVREHVSLGHFSKDNEWLGGLWANHLRLYTPELLAEHLGAGGFQVEDMRALTRACVPFQSLILYAGRQAYTRLPAPESVRATMEKFAWRESQEQPWSLPRAILRGGLKVFQAVDRRNERMLSLDGPSVHLAAKARKPDSEPAEHAPHPSR